MLVERFLHANLRLVGMLSTLHWVWNQKYREIQCWNEEDKCNLSELESSLTAESQYFAPNLTQNNMILY